MEMVPLSDTRLECCTYTTSSGNLETHFLCEVVPIFVGRLEFHQKYMHWRSGEFPIDNGSLILILILEVRNDFEQYSKI